MRNYVELKDYQYKNVKPIVMARTTRRKAAKFFGCSVRAILEYEPGAYVKRSDLEHMLQLDAEIREEIRKGIASDPNGINYIYDMFEYELMNHGFEDGDSVMPVLEDVYLTPEDIKKDHRLTAGLLIAVANLTGQPCEFVFQTEP